MKTYDYYRDMYLFHAQTKAFQKRVAQSNAIIEQFLALGVKSTVNISGGKDSTAMMHMVWQLCPNIQCVSEKDDMDFPEELPYMHLLREKYQLNLDIITPSVSLWSQIQNFDVTEDLHSKGTDFSDTYFYALLKEYQAQNNIKGVFLGLRAEESNGRAWNAKKNGHIYYNQTWQHMVCQPLAWWTTADVFAYLFSNDIPILDVYFKNQYAEPEQIRKAWILPSSRAAQGQAVWLKHYYPDIFNKLAAKQASIRCFV